MTEVIEHISRMSRKVKDRVPDIQRSRAATCDTCAVLEATFSTATSTTTAVSTTQLCRLRRFLAGRRANGWSGERPVPVVAAPAAAAAGKESRFDSEGTFSQTNVRAPKADQLCTADRA